MGDRRSEHEGTLTLEEVARYPRPGMAVPGRIAFAPDGKTVTFLYRESGTRCGRHRAAEVRGGTMTG